MDSMLIKAYNEHCHSVEVYNFGRKNHTKPMSFSDFIEFCALFIESENV